MIKYNNNDLLYLNNIIKLDLTNKINYNLNNYKIDDNDNNITNNIEESINNSTNEYVIQLFIQYVKYRHGDVNSIVSKLIKNNICDLNSLIELCPDFYDYIKLCDKLKDYYLYHLINKKIDVDNKNTFEINKGEFDTASTSQTTIISKYAGSMDLCDGVLYKVNNKVYLISENGNISEIPEESTILIHNPYNIINVLYTLEVLSGSNNYVVLGSWGYDDLKKEQLKIQKNYLKVIELLNDKSNPVKIINNSTNELDGVNCSSLTINTKNLIEIIPFTKLLTKREIDLLKSVIFNINYNETKEQGNKKVR